MADQKLLSRKEAAKYLGVQTETLHNWACTKRYNLRFTKVGSLAKYRKEDLDKFLADNVIEIKGEEKE